MVLDGNGAYCWFVRVYRIDPSIEICFQIEYELLDLLHNQEDYWNRLLPEDTTNESIEITLYPIDS